ncbi:respiratory nitrate reductase subunit gamma [Chloroflexota bacterium]
MDNVLQIATYFAYVFVTVAYTVKVWKYFKMPNSLRWDIYPIPHEGKKHGGSYMEEPEFWTEPQKKNTLADIWDMAKKYLTMSGYFRRVRSYWLGLYPWHVGFYLIVLFHGLAFLGALLIETADLEIGGSAGFGGQLLYYITLVVAVGSFALGTIGSIGMLVKRLTDDDLKDYASPQNFFNYIFFLALFISGLVVYFGTNGTFNEYREFWVGLITLDTVNVSGPEQVHILLFAIFLCYLPFTRSTHYITMPLYYFRVRWNDKLNRGEPEDDNKLGQLLSQPVSWSAPHIQTGKNWGEIVAGMPEQEKGEK